MSAPYHITLALTLTLEEAVKAYVLAVLALHQERRLNTAKALGISRGCLIKRLRAWQVPPRQRGRRAARAVKLYQRGWDVRYIAEELHCATASIYRWIRAAGVPLRRSAGQQPQEAAHG